MCVCESEREREGGQVRGERERVVELFIVSVEGNLCVSKTACYLPKSNWQWNDGSVALNGINLEQ